MEGNESSTKKNLFDALPFPGTEVGKLEFSYHPSHPLRFVYTRDLDLAISLSDAISIEILPSFQIAMAGDGDNI